MLTVSSNFGDFSKGFAEQVQSTLEEALVDEIVAEASKEGWTNVDDVDLTVNGASVDIEKIRREANHRLSGLVASSSSLIKPAEGLIP